MDYAQPPGQESRLVGYSLNRHKYPYDPRGLTFVKQNGEHGLTSPQVVYLNGRRFRFVGGMFASNFINIFRYDFQGLDPKGNSMYSADKITVLEPPEGVKQIARVVYLDDTDTLIGAHEGSDMRHISRVFVGKGYLAGNRKTVSFVPGAGQEAGCVAAAGDYVFTGGWKESGRVWINRLSDGADVGIFDPGLRVGGVENTGWIDILTGISAHRRANGEYLVFVEEDYKAKVLLYRWKP